MKNTEINDCGFKDVEDNLLYLVLGSSDGKLHSYINIGTINQPDWIEHDSIFSNINVGSNSNQAFGDLDNDGDMDVVIGEGDVEFNFYENSGTDEYPIWSRDDSMISDIFVGYSNTPTFVDLDDDGDLDLTMGWYSGGMGYFQNIGTQEFPEWLYLSSMYNGVGVGNQAAPALADLDNDGDYDLTIGRYDGQLVYYKNTGDSVTPEWTEENTMFEGIDAGFLSTPEFYDLDKDGDYDLIIGQDSGRLSYFENTGSRLVPTWTENTNLFSGISVGGNSVATFVYLKKPNLKSMGSYIDANETVIKNSEFSNNFCGIIIEGKNNTFENNLVNSNEEYGILLKNARNNLIANNTIKSQENYGIGLYSFCQNNLLINNDISNSKKGIIISESSYNEIIGQQFIDNLNGISVISESNENNIIDSIFSSSHNGILLSNSKNNKISENIVINSKNSLYFNDESDGNKIDNNIISNNKVGLIVTNSDDNFFLGNQIIKNDFGSFITKSSNIKLTNCTFYSFGEDLNLTDSQVSSINSTFDQDNVGLVGSILDVNWYLNIFISKNNKYNADISIMDAKGIEIFKKDTKTNQWNNWIICKEYEQDEIEKINFTPHLIKISKQNVFINDSKLFVDSNKKVNINWPDYAVFVECLENEREILPGEKVTYNLSVVNWGEKNDNIYLSLRSPDNWISYFNKTNFILENDSYGYTNLTVIAQNSLFDKEDILVKASSNSNFTRDHEITLTNLLRKITKINTLSNPIEKRGYPGRDIEYRLEIENIGNYEFELYLEINASLSDNITNWSITNLSNLEPFKLDVGETGIIPIIISSPANSLANEQKLIVFDIILLESNKKIGEILSLTKINQVHKIILNIEENKKEAFPGEIINYTINITNIGNGKDTIYLDYFGENQDWVFHSWNSDYLTLEINERKTITVTVIPPENANFDEYARITFNATFKEDYFLTSIKQFHSSEIEIPYKFIYAYPDEKISLDFNIINNGNNWDGLLFSFNESFSIVKEGWKLGNSDYKEKIINQKNSFIENFKLQTGKYAKEGEICILKFDVYSINASKILSTINITIQIKRIYEILLISDIQEMEVFAGREFKYNITISNSGNGDDEIKLEYFGENKNWGIFENTNYIIDSNSSINVLLTVNIPVYSKKGEISEISVVAISKNGNISNILKFITSVNTTNNILPSGIIKIKIGKKEVKRILIGTEIIFDGGYSFDEDGEIIEYRWELGNGVVLFGKNITYTYPKETKPGEYIIKLIISDNNGTVTETKTRIDLISVKEKIDIESYLILISLMVIGIIVIISILKLVKGMKKILK